MTPNEMAVSKELVQRIKEGLRKAGKPLLMGAPPVETSLYGRPAADKLQGGLWVGSPGMMGGDGQALLQENYLVDVAGGGDDEAVIFTVEEPIFDCCYDTQYMCGMVLPGTDANVMQVSRISVDVEDLIEVDVLRPEDFERYYVTEEKTCVTLLRLLEERTKEGNENPLPLGWIKGVLEGMKIGAYPQTWLDASIEDRRIIQEPLYAKTQKQLYHIARKPLPPTEVWAVVWVLPPDLYDAVKSVARAGWVPILPQWQTRYGFTTNTDWRVCMRGGDITVNGKMPAYEAKFVSWYSKAFTFHNEYGRRSPVQTFPWKTPDAWRKQFLDMCLEMSGWGAPQGDNPEKRAQMANLSMDLIRESSAYVWTQPAKPEHVEERAIQVCSKGKDPNTLTAECVSIRTIGEDEEVDQQAYTGIKAEPQCSVYDLPDKPECVVPVSQG